MLRTGPSTPRHARDRSFDVAQDRSFDMLRTGPSTLLRTGELRTGPSTCSGQAMNDEVLTLSRPSGLVFLMSFIPWADAHGYMQSPRWGGPVFPGDESVYVSQRLLRRTSRGAIFGCRFATDEVSRSLDEDVGSRCIVTVRGGVDGLLATARRGATGGVGFWPRHAVALPVMAGLGHGTPWRYG